MLVSACLIVYNHERFIEACIEGAINQQVDFEYEILISDDFSSDKSTVICQAYAEKYPDLISFVKHPKNLGMHGNWMSAISKCNGKYIAICEGDDYWTDPLKLQKQVDFLESHLEYEVCFTNIKVIDGKGKTLKDQLITDGRKINYEKKDLPIWAPTLTRVFRNRDFCERVPNVPGLDTIMLLYQSNFGKIHFIPEITGVYRMHDGGIYSAQSEAYKKEAIIITFIESLKLLESDLFYKYYGLIFKKLVELRLLDYKKYIENKSIFFSLNRAHINRFTWIQIIKIIFSKILLSTPIFIKSISYKNLLLRILNRIFIYNK